MKLSEKEISGLKEKLEKEAGELEAQINASAKNQDFGSDIEADFSEEADEAEEFAGSLGLQDALKSRLGDIEKALDKISNGTYGKCENCGKDIPLELLKVNPESRLCKTCKVSK